MVSREKTAYVVAENDWDVCVILQVIKQSNEINTSNQFLISQLGYCQKISTVPTEECQTWFKRLLQRLGKGRRPFILPFFQIFLSDVTLFL